MSDTPVPQQPTVEFFEEVAAVFRRSPRLPVPVTCGYSRVSMRSIGDWLERSFAYRIGSVWRRLRRLRCGDP